MVGAAPIIAVDPLSTARGRALAFEADIALDPTSADFAEAEAADQATGGRGVQAAFDFASAPAARAQAAAAPGPEGSWS